MRSMRDIGECCIEVGRKAVLVGSAAAMLVLIASCVDPTRAIEDEGLPVVVTRVQPSAAGQSETVEVRIFGSGFRPSYAVALERDGGVDSRVVVERTVYVSEGELIATVSVQPNAATGRYTVTILGDRKKGIGTEFDILAGIGSELSAKFSFSYDGYRSDRFDVDHTFILNPATLDPGSWGVTSYNYRYGEQFLSAHHLRQDGRVDLMWCWTPGGKVNGPGTRQLECWFTPQYNFETRQPGDPEDYDSWIGGDRPGDGSGTVTFTSVSPERLAGTFSITMHVGDWPDWHGSPTISIRDGTFDLPIVSTYWNHDQDEANQPRDPDPVAFQGATAMGINDDGVVAGMVADRAGGWRAARWFPRPDRSMSGPEELGTVEGATWQHVAGINNEGTIFGNAYNARPYISDEVAFVHDGRMRRLRNLDGAFTSKAFGANDRGIVVGQSWLTDINVGRPPVIRGTVWLDPMNPESQPLQLPAFGNSDVNYGRHINNNGLIVGFSGGASNSVAWQLHENGTISEPLHLGLRIVNGLNDRSDFVGHRPISGARVEAVFLRGDSYVALNPLPGHDSASGTALSNPPLGEPVIVVGQSGSEEMRAVKPVVWSVNAAGELTGPTALPLPQGYTRGIAIDVNRHGWIVGFAYEDDLQSTRVATLWRPVSTGRAGYELITLRPLDQPSAARVPVSGARTRCVGLPGGTSRCR
jgi:hypothetical protein